MSSGFKPFESLILLQKKKGVNRLYSKKGTGAKEAVGQVVCVGDQRNCPQCQSAGRVVWVSLDKKTMGVQCHMNHREAERPASKYGATIVRSGKTKKNIVFITAAA